MFYTCTDSENDNSNENEELLLEPAAEDMDNKGKLPAGASMPVTDLYRRKHKTDSKSVEFMSDPPLLLISRWLPLPKPEMTIFPPPARIICRSI